MRQSHRFFPLLDGIRGVASMLIVLRHTLRFFLPVGFQESYLAVDVFFLLSGVVICNAYEERFVSGMTAFHFAKIRLIRIYPLYLLGQMLGVALFVWPVIPATYLPFSIMMALTMPTWFFSMNPPAWSLCVELIGNFVYGMIARRLGRYVLAAIITVSAAAFVAEFYVCGFGSLDKGPYLREIYAGFFRFGYSFFAGIALCRYAASLRAREVQSNAAAWLLLAMVAFILCLSPSQAMRPWYDFLAVTLAFPAIIFVSLFIKPGRISTGIFAFFGSISYALYTLHYSVARLIDRIFRAGGVDVKTYSPLSGVLLMVFLAALCWWIDKVYDGPVRRYLSRKFLRYSTV